MKTFKKVIYVTNRTIGVYGFGFGVAQLLNGRYQLAAWFLFGVSILFMIGYFTEVFSK